MRFRGSNISSLVQPFEVLQLPNHAACLTHGVSAIRFKEALLLPARSSRHRNEIKTYQDHKTQITQMDLNTLPGRKDFLRTYQGQ